MAAGRDHVRIGDPFTAQVERGDGPPTVIYWLNQSTGRRHCTRVRVDACYALRASDVAGAVRNTVKQLPELGAAIYLGTVRCTAQNLCIGE